MSKYQVIMNNNTTLSFKNRSFRQVELILVLFLIFAVVQAIFFENRYANFIGGAFVAIIIVSMQQPYRYTIEGNKLIFKFHLKRNKIINIADIQEIDVAKHNCLPFTYKPSGYDNVSHVRLLVNDIAIKVIQEELTKRNSNIEVLFS